MTNPSRNIDHIIQEIFPYINGGISLFCFLAFCLEKYTWITSALLGAFFSYLGFRHLVDTSLLILQKQKKELVPIKLLMRLLIYAVPIMIGIKLTAYFNLWVILVFLFTFQVSFILSELIRNLKQVRKRDV